MTLNRNKLLSETIVTGVKKLVNKSKSWSGTMTDLNQFLVSKLNKNVSSSWVGSPSALRVALNRVIRKVRAQGIKVRFYRTPDHARTRIVEFVKK